MLVNPCRVGVAEAEAVAEDSSLWAIGTVDAAAGASFACIPQH